MNIAINQLGKRNSTIDIVKGMGIFLMVIRHARAPYSDFVLLFHMAIFFIASGYLYDIRHTKGIGEVSIYTKETKNVVFALPKLYNQLHFTE